MAPVEPFIASYKGIYKLRAHCKIYWSTDSQWQYKHHSKASARKRKKNKT